MREPSPNPSSPASAGGKQIAIEVEVPRVTFRTVSYLALDKTFAGKLPQWQFLKDFQPVTGKRKPL